MDYYVDTLVDKFGFNRIHADGCKHLPKGVSRLFLGNFENISSVIDFARTYFFPKAMSCGYCCPLADRLAHPEQLNPLL